VVICLEQSANDLHMVQLMPLPPYHLLLHALLKSTIGSAFLFLAYPGCPGCILYTVCIIVPSVLLHCLLSIR